MRHFALILAVFIGLLVTDIASARSGAWQDSHGRPVPETESMKSKDGFAGTLIVTPDEGWKAKWDTPSETRPNFNTAGVVSHGKRVFVLTFFSNPKLDDQGNANVRCDLQITSPAGRNSLSQKDVICYAGKIQGSLRNLYLSAPVIAFSGDPGDPAGTWVVDATLRDAVRRVDLPLSATFGMRDK